MATPNPNKQPVELNRTSLYLGLFTHSCFGVIVLQLFLQLNLVGPQ